jgi:two-component system response regulator LytT
MENDGVYAVCIVEDELPARELLIDFILTRSELKLAGIARNGNDALAQLSDQRFDLVLMDVHLPHCSGLQVLERLRDIPYVIFTTAHERYAIKAFDVGAVDYLLKPFTVDRFNRSIDKFLCMQRSPHARNYDLEPGFAFRTKGRHHLLPYNDVYFFTSSGKHTVVHSAAGDYEFPELLKDIEMRLPHHAFARIHKRYIVNLMHINSIEYFSGGQYTAFLRNDDETSLPVGRGYAPGLKSRLRLV